jgi:RNA recognition motif-containing protein
LTHDNLQAWGDAQIEEHCTVSGDEGSEDLQVSTAPWCRKGAREEYSDQGKWNSSTFSGKSAKSRSGRDRDYEGFARESRSAKNGRSKDLDSYSGGSKNPNTLILRGLPFNVTEGEVRTFIKEAGVSRYLSPEDGAVSLITNMQGRPSGYAELQLAKATDYWEVRPKLHMRYFGQRYVEVLPQQSRPGQERNHERGYDRRDRGGRDHDRSNHGSWRR